MYLCVFSFFSTVTGEHSSYAATGGRGKKIHMQLQIMGGVNFQFRIIVRSKPKYDSKIIKLLMEVYHVSDTLIIYTNSSVSRIR